MSEADREWEELRALIGEHASWKVAPTETVEQESPGARKTGPYESLYDETVEHGEDDIVRELLCEMCGRDYPVWSADSDLWNEVMREPGPEDEYAFVCPTCFTVRAAFMGVETSFHLRRSAPREVGWQKCPVCSGRGEVPSDFYPAHLTTTLWETTCRTCKGKGIMPVGPPIGDEE